MTYPQQPGAFPAQYQWAQPPQPAQPSRRGLMLVLGVVAGLVLGAGGVALGWVLSSSGSDARGPLADVTTACSLIERTDSINMETNYAGFRRWAAAAELVAAAAEVDPQHRQLEETLRMPIVIYQQEFSTDGPQFAEAVRQARQACARY